MQVLDEEIEVKFRILLMFNKLYWRSRIITKWILNPLVSSSSLILWTFAFRGKVLYIIARGAVLINFAVCTLLAPPSIACLHHALITSILLAPPQYNFVLFLFKGLVEAQKRTSGEVRKLKKQFVEIPKIFIER